ncbi:MAG: hypoxanthine phosphoribosyltransferase [Alphaproteobacteria bacterium]|nr:hypoxanthine phosphoribosyltransferase [Alphaproteobacteria bacterium]
MTLAPKELFSAKAIAERVEAMGREIGTSMPPDLVVVAVLKGGFVFAADLIRAVGRAGARPEVDFVMLESYREGTESSGRVVVRHDLEQPVAGRHVLLVDDILESGRTLGFARDLLKKRGAAQVRIAVLLDKPHKRKVELEADFVGFDCPEVFVVGYGLDHAHRHRELPYIGTLSQR